LGRFGVVDAAVNEARYRLALDPRRRSDGDWGTPVLIMNTPSGELYSPTPVGMGAYLPEDLRQRFLPVLKEFVDRNLQQDMLHDMIKGNKAERILFVQGSGGMGKSWFIERSVAWCIEQGIQWRGLDFRIQPDKPWDYLTVIDEMLLPCETAFDKYRAMKDQVTVGGLERERAFIVEKQKELTKEFVAGLTALAAGTRLVYFLDQHSDARAPEPVQRWLWGVLLPLFQDRTLRLGHITLVLADRNGPPDVKSQAWYHVLESTTLEPLTREHFIEYARVRELLGVSVERLNQMYDDVADVAATYGETELTPLRLSLTLDKAKQRQSSGGTR
jgi:hypothetical protein